MTFIPDDAGAGIRAQDDAAQAATRSGVVIRELDDMGSLAAVQRLYEVVWRTGPAGTPVTADLLRALAMSGNPVFGAYDGDDDLLGACFGFCSPPGTHNFHSHIAGVPRSAQGRSIGLALKLHQRAWALARHMRTMTWTFDPAIRRNAYFNLAKLGAEPVEYFSDLYGSMDDDVNRDDASDRLLVRWQLDRPLPTQKAHLDRRSSRAAPIRVRVPADIEAMRLEDPERAAAWRLELRRELGGRMRAGARVVSFEREGHYLVEAAESGPDSASTSSGR